MDTSYMSDSSMDSRDVVDTSVVNYSIGVHKRIGLSLSLRFSLSLTLAVHVVVVEGMRVDTSYMLDSRDMSVIDSCYSVANSSVVDQQGVSFSLSIDGNSTQEDKDYGSHGAVDSRDSQ